MYLNMKEWSQEIIDAKDRRFLPVLYFPCLKLTEHKVIDTVTDAKKMAEVMVATVREYPAIIGAMTGMDLTVDAEAFGAPVRFKKNDVPCLCGILVETMEDAEKLQVPDPRAGRLGVHYDAVRETAKEVTDRPVFGGQLGPFSLAANLMPLMDALMNTIHAPALMHAVLEKATQHLINRALAYKEAGANGVLLAEPTAGLLSPEVLREKCDKQLKDTQDFPNFVFSSGCDIPVITSLDNIRVMTDSLAAYNAAL